MQDAFLFQVPFTAIHEYRIHPEREFDYSLGDTLQFLSTELFRIGTT